MASARVDLFCEDRGHEQFVAALVARLGSEMGVPLRLSTVSGRGGKGPTLRSLQVYQRALAKGHLGRAVPDLLIAVVDTNCAKWHEVRNETIAHIDSEVLPQFAVGCPDPHVERWCLADPEGFRTVVGAQPPADPDKCERDVYKKLLRDSIRAAGHPILTDEMEFAPDIVRAMNLFDAGKNQPSLKHFVEDLKGKLLLLNLQA